MLFKSVISFLFLGANLVHGNPDTPVTVTLTSYGQGPSWPLNATQNTFWMYVDTTTTCPYSKSNKCNYRNDTEIIVYPNQTAVMNVAVKGGQAIYVASNGLLSYQAVGQKVPSGASTTGFGYYANYRGTNDLTFAYNGNAVSLYACPQSPTYTFWAAVPGFVKQSGCQPISITATPNSANVTGPAAYEYT